MARNLSSEKIGLSQGGLWEATGHEVTVLVDGMRVLEATGQPTEEQQYSLQNRELAGDPLSQLATTRSLQKIETAIDICELSQSLYNESILCGVVHSVGDDAPMRCVSTRRWQWGTIQSVVTTQPCGVYQHTAA